MGNPEQQRRMIVQRREDEEREQRIRDRYIREQQKKVMQTQNPRRENLRPVTYNVPAMDNSLNGEKIAVKVGRQMYIQNKSNMNLMKGKSINIGNPFRDVGLA